ncbi:MAG: EAL domain-containing protein [Chloroflexi bacterium]|nr:MAG: EAL domain-containing protein [Chloroflexota bacterium]
MRHRGALMLRRANGHSAVPSNGGPVATPSDAPVQVGDRERLAQLVASTLDAVVTMDHRGIVTGWNPMAEETFGWSAAEAVGHPMQDLILPARYRIAHQTGFARYLKTGTARILNQRIEVEALHRSGKEIPVELTVVAVRRDGHPEFSAFIRDLSRVRAAEAAQRESEERYRELVEGLPGIVYLDRPGALAKYISPQVEPLLGYSVDEWLADPDLWVKLLHPDDRERAVAELAAGEASGERFMSEYRLVARDGRVVWIRDEATPTRDQQGVLVHGVMIDVTRVREIEAELEAEVAERAEVASSLASFTGGPTPEATAAALCAGLVRLRTVDIAVVYAFEPGGAVPLGVAAPPGAPVAVGRRLPSARATYLRAGAERGPWVEEWRDAAGLDEHLGAWLEVGLRAGVHVPLMDGGVPYGLLAAATTADVGSEVLASRIPALLEFATVANAILGPQLRARGSEASISALRDLISAGSVRTVFQPVLNLTSGEIVGYEALTRFPDGSEPLQRFGEAERAGLSGELELTCLASALTASAALPEGRWLSVNVTPAALPSLGKLAALAGHDGRQLVIEITERLPIDDYHAARRQLRRHFPHARIAVDDAGAGFASLRHIAELRPAIVKLDIALVRNLHRDPAREALIAGMVHFAAASGCDLIAEGIESPAERRALVRLGVEFGQGYLLGKPVPAGRD